MVRDLIDPDLPETERALARARMLLDRYGIVSREAAAAEDLPGGFGPLYRVLRAMEDAGRVRRGWFVDGLSAAQFASPGAVDRLRASVPEITGQILAAVDPANPYGALIPWPETAGDEASKPRRVPGAWVVLVGGRPGLYASSGGRHVLTFPGAGGQDEDALAEAFRHLSRLPSSWRRRFCVTTVDGTPVGESPHRSLMERCGFSRDYRGLVPAPERQTVLAEELRCPKEIRSTRPRPG